LQGGIEKWTVDRRRMIMTFYDKPGREMKAASYWLFSW
jgi:hypothetical protein